MEWRKERLPNSMTTGRISGQSEWQQNIINGEKQTMAVN
jgi:hypothetical protein